MPAPRHLDSRSASELNYLRSCDEASRLRTVRSSVRDDTAIANESQTPTPMRSPNVSTPTLCSYHSGWIKPAIVPDNKFRDGLDDHRGIEHSRHRLSLRDPETTKASDIGTTLSSLQKHKTAAGGEGPRSFDNCPQDSRPLHPQPDYGLSSMRHITSSDEESHQKIYLLKICEALMTYGAPTHRLEQYAHFTAEVLGLTLESFYLPGCMFISFNGALWASTELRIIRTLQTLNLSKLQDVHTVYKQVIHEKLAIGEAVTQLQKITSGRDEYPRWVKVLAYGLACMCIGPVSYGARPIDLPIIFVLGCLVGFMEIILASTWELYGQVFEVSAAILTFALGRCFGSIIIHSSRPFCFSAIAQASLVMILPGFTITTSALELQSKNIVSGSVRMVYGIIYMCFLAFGSTVGATIYGAIDASAVSSDTCAAPSPFWWQIIFVAPFTLSFVIVNQGRWNKSLVTILITLAGWVVIHFFEEYFPDYTPLSQALGAFAVGILANLHSRLGHGVAMTVLHPAVFVQVPGSFAASGSLISGIANANRFNGRDVYGTNQTSAANQPQFSSALLSAGYSMVEIAIGITVGLSVSTLLVYPRTRKTRRSGFFTF